MRTIYFIFVSSLVAAACTGDDGGPSSGGAHGTVQAKIGAQCRDAQVDCERRIRPVVDQGTAQLENCANEISAACRDGYSDDCVKAHADCQAEMDEFEPEATAAQTACQGDIAAACAIDGTIEGPIGPECQVVIETCAGEAAQTALRGIASCVVPAIDACLDSADSNACIQAEVRCLRAAATVLTDGVNWLSRCRADVTASCL